MRVHSALVFGLAAVCLLGAITSPVRGTARSQDAHPRSTSPGPSGIDAPEPLQGPPAPAGAIAAPPTQLSDLFAAPERFVGETLQFVVQLHSAPDTWNPYLTRFGPREFRALRVWSDDQFPWRVEDDAHPTGLVFLRREGALADLPERLRVNQRVRVVAHVSQVFLGRPWIEIVTAEPLENHITRGTVIHASRALARMEQGRFGMARLDLARALQAPAPAAARLELERLDRFCAQTLAEAEAAKQARGNLRVQPLGGRRER